MVGSAQSMGRLLHLPWHTLLLAAYAVLFVYASNIGEVLPIDLARPLSIALLAGAVMLAACALLYRDLRRGALLASAVVVAAGYFGHIGRWLSNLGLPETVQLAVVGAAVGAVALYAAGARRMAGTTTPALNTFAAMLVGLALVSIVPFEWGRATRATQAGGDDDATTIATTRRPERDIYFLVFDRYGSDWSIRARFGLENDLPEWLAEQGFQVIPGARSNYRATDFSLATILNMRLLDDLTESVGRVSSDREPARTRVVNHSVGRFLKANGYRYYHMGSWWAPTWSNPMADEVLMLGRTTEFEAVLHDSSIAPALERLVGAGARDTPNRERHRNDALFALRQIERLSGVPGRKFVFAHVLLPHPPYVMHADGSHLLDAEATARPEAELYAEQLAFTNTRIRQVVAALTAGPEEERPIIVITGDEGPFLCGEVDCVDGSPESLGIRFGTLRAYYLPGIDHQVPPDDTGVNIFRMLFREYFGADLPDLPNRSFNWPDNDHLYDFHDITDQLPLPGG